MSEVAEIINGIANHPEALDAIRKALHPQKDWTDTMQALIPPSIALLGIGIGILQYLLNKSRLKHESHMDKSRMDHEKRMDEYNYRQNLFDKRYEVYEIVVDVLANTVAGMGAKSEDWGRYHSAQQKSLFLFDKEIGEYLKNLSSNMRKLNRLRVRQGRELHINTADAMKNAEEVDQLLKWHEDELQKMESVFFKYLHL